MADAAHKVIESEYQPEIKQFLITRFWDKTLNQPREHARLIVRGRAVKCGEAELPVGIFTQFPI